MKVLVHVCIQTTAVMEVSVDDNAPTEALTKSLGEPRLTMTAFLAPPISDADAVKDDEDMQVKLTNAAYIALAHWTLKKATNDGTEVADVATPDKSLQN